MTGEANALLEDDLRRAMLAGASLTNQRAHVESVDDALCEVSARLRPSKQEKRTGK